MQSAVPIEAGKPSARAVVARTAVALLVAFGVAAVLGRTYRVELEGIGKSFVASFGYGGMFLGTLLADGFSFPVPPWFYFVMSVASGASPIKSIAAVSAASVLAACLAYAMSARVASLGLFRGRMQAARDRLAPMLARHGAWAMVGISFIPLPFSFSCYALGSYRVGPRLFGLYVLLRIPRLLVFYALVRLGWS